MRLIGGVFLGYLGLKIFLSKPNLSERHKDSPGLLGSYTSSLLLTITNPMTILSFVAAFAGLGLSTAGGDYTLAAAMVALSSITGHFRTKMSFNTMLWINRLSGVVICSFAVVALFSLVRK